MTTTVPVSSVPAVIEYLLGAIQAQCQNDALFNQMLIKVGQPGPDLPNDRILIGAVHRSEVPTTVIGSGGQYWLNEDYTVTITAESWSGSGDGDDGSIVAIALTQRAWQLAAYVETAVRADPSLGSLVNDSWPRDTITEGAVWTENPTGLIVSIEMPIYVRNLN